MPSSLQLTLRKGPGPGLTFPLDREAITIGRGFQNNISIVSKEISRQHARLVRLEEGGYAIEDLGSTNGTRVNGQPIVHRTEIHLGDTIQLGTEVELVLESITAEESTLMIARSQFTTGLSADDAKKTQVFISYSRSDKDFVQKMHRDLNELGFKVWVDWEGIPPSADWMEEIVQAIGSADVFVFVMSPDSLKSTPCAEELRKASELNKNIIPVLYRDPDPEDVLPDKLSAANWVFMRDEQEYRNNLSEMANIFSTDLEWVKDHTRLLVRAIEWQDSAKNTGSLLRGTELTEAEIWLANSALQKLKPTALHLEYIQESRRQALNRQRRNQTIGTTVLVVLALMLVFSINQSRLAEQARVRAVNAAATAGISRNLAISSRQTAVANEQIAVDQQATAQAASTQAVAQQQVAEEQRAMADAARLEAEAAKAEAETERNRAVAEAVRARSSQLAAQAQQLVETNAPLSTILAVEALKANPFNLEAQGVLSTLPYYYPPIQMFFAGHDSPVTALDWSASGQLASGSEKGEIFIWDLSAHQPAVILDDHTGPVHAIAWGPGGELASASEDGSVIIWDLESETPAIVLDEHVGPVYSVAWAPDGRLASGGADNQVLVYYSLRSDPVRLSMAGDVRVVAWSTGGQLASGSADNTARVWNLDTGSSKSLVGHTDDVLSLGWGPQEQLATGSGDSTIIVWDPVQARELERLEAHTGSVLSLDWAPDNLLVTSSEDQRVIVWDMNSDSEPTILRGHTASVPVVIWGDPGHIYSGSLDQSFIHWEIKTLSNSLTGHFDQIRSLSWSPDGSQFASASDDFRIHLWDTTSGEIVSTFRSHRDRVFSLAWSPSAELASGSNDGNVILWDLEGRQSRLILDDHQAPVHTVAWGPNDELASGDSNGTVIVWDLQFARPDKILEAHSGSVHALDWSPGGVLASGGDNGEVILWNIETNTPAQQLEGHTDAVLSVAWSSEGRLASASADETIIIWDLALGTPEQVLEGHTDSVNAVAWSQDGRLLSASDDRSVIIWDLALGMPEQVLIGHEEEVLSLAWHPDSTYFASGGGDNAIYILPEKFLEEPCGWGVRNLAPGAEWNYYFPLQEYQEICPSE